MSDTLSAEQEAERLVADLPYDGEWDWVYDGSSTYSIGGRDDPQADHVASVYRRKHDQAAPILDVLVAAPRLLRDLLTLVQRLREERDEARVQMAALAQGRDVLCRELTTLRTQVQQVTERMRQTAIMAGAAATTAGELGTLIMTNIEAMHELWVDELEAALASPPSADAVARAASSEHEPSTREGSSHE